MGFVITPHHACCIGLVPGPLILLPLFTPPFCFPPPLPWCLLGNHVVTLPDSSLLKSAVDKNSPRPVMWKRFARHTAYISAPPPSPHYHQQILTFSRPSEALRCSLLPLTCEGWRRRPSPGRKAYFLLSACTDAASAGSHHLGAVRAASLCQFELHSSCHVT